MESRIRIGQAILWLVATMFCILNCTSNFVVAGPTDPIQLWTFQHDATPPMGHPLSGGSITPVTDVEDPELIKGIVLKQGEEVYVLAALDWCTLRNDAYDDFRKQIARGAGTIASQVALQLVHQHDAPTLDSGAQRMLNQHPNPPFHVDLEWYEGLIRRVGDTVHEAMQKPSHTITHVGTGQAKVDRVAAARRILTAEGSVLIRWSSTTDPKMHALPEGRIDPMLKTVSLFAGEQPVVQLHYYATHPQSHYGGGRPSWDVPGIAREQLQKETGVFQVYFTGCAGDITMGKYNNGSDEARIELAGRLHDAMHRSLAAIERVPLESLGWRVEAVRFTLGNGPKFDGAANVKIMADPEANPMERINAALNQAWNDRVAEGRPVETSCLSLGDVRLVHLPGEPFIEFQLAAQAMAPDLFVAVAGYGEGATGYICEARAFDEGGYEPTASNVAPESEGLLKEVIGKLLAP